MGWEIKLRKEILFFVLVAMASGLFWLIVAFITEQNIIAPEYQYLREKAAVILTIGFIYFIRFNVWMTQ